MRFYFTLCLFVCTSLLLEGQDLQQTLSGYIKDGNTPLIGATVNLESEFSDYNTVSDEEGKYRFENIPIGRYKLSASYLGYTTIKNVDLELRTGKQVFYNIALSPAEQGLEEITVIGHRVKADYEPLTRTMTWDKTLRYAGSFDDFARTNMSEPGFNPINDQANHFSYRGLSPNFINWQIEGLDILNPNHTSNAGTPNDLGSRSGGGVSMLSTQIMGASKFHGGAIEPGQGNSLAGIFDMALRNGNNENLEHTIQFGLLGLDLATEGPMLKKGSYNINYRYSTLGILSGLGLQLGDEDIRFQDLAANIFLPTKNGYFKIFGLYGLSNNDFIGAETIEEAEIGKDLKDIIFKQSLGVLGFKSQQYISKKLTFDFGLAYSNRNIDRDEQFRFTDAPRIFDQALDESLLNFKSKFNWKFSPKGNINFGLRYSELKFKYGVDLANSEELSEISQNTVNPFLNTSYYFGKLKIEAGVSLLSVNSNDDEFISPRLKLSRNFKTWSIAMSYNLEGQLYDPFLQLANITNASTTPFIKAHQYNFNFNKQFGGQYLFSLNAYYYDLFHVPVGDFEDSYSALNLFDDLPAMGLGKIGSGQNYGIEVAFEKSIKHGFYYRTNFTFYKARTADQIEVWRDSRFDGRYIFNLMAGKEFNKTKNNKRKTFGINGHLALAGGNGSYPVDLMLSRQAVTTVYDFSNGPNVFLKDVFRINLRLYWKTNKAKKSSILSLDIQNLTNNENEAFRFYDILLDEISLQKQLGIIPVLSYRVEF